MKPAGLQGSIVYSITDGQDVPHKIAQLEQHPGGRQAPAPCPPWGQRQPAALVVWACLTYKRDPFPSSPNASVPTHSITSARAPLRVACLPSAAVAVVEPDYKVRVFADVRPDDTNFALQWHHPVISSEAAWATQTGNDVVKVRKAERKGAAGRMWRGCAAVEGSGSCRGRATTAGLRSGLASRVPRESLHNWLPRVISKSHNIQVLSLIPAPHPTPPPGVPR